MLDCYITFRSATQAQQGLRAFDTSGIRAQLMRAPKQLSDQGCAYALLIRRADAMRAVTQLRAHGVPFRKVVRLTPSGEMEEVAL